ncbi:MAG: VOC family protein [Anaerolineae bacterium]
MVHGLNFVLMHVPNVADAIPFYTDVMGLEIEDRQPGFVQFKAGPGAANFALSEGQGEPIELWWFVADAEAARVGLAQSGADEVSPIQAMPFGRVFTTRDPSGRTLYMLELGQPQQA